MTSTPLGSESSLRASERRSKPRRPVNSLAYIELGDDNGGIVINFSEGGLAVQAAMPIPETQLSRIRFQLPRSGEWAEGTAEIAWASESRKLAGIRFVGIADEAREEIRSWVAGEAAPAVLTADALPRKKESPSLESPPPRVARKLVPELVAAKMESAGFAREFLAEAAPAAEVREPDPEPVLEPATARVLEPATEPVRELVEVAATAPAVRPAQLGTAIFGLREPSPTDAAVHDAFSAPPRSGWTLALGACALVVISFVAGVGVGRGYLRTWTGYFTAHQTAPPSVASPTTIPMAAASPVTAPSAPAPLTTAVIPPATDAAIAVPRSAVMVPTPAAGNPPATVNLPEEPVDASPSVAISSSETVDIPAEASLASHPGSASLLAAELVSHPDPEYTAEAVQEKVEGTVKLRVTVAVDGSIAHAETLSGPPLLAAAAVKAVQQWSYKPALLNGRPISVQQNITIAFRLPPPIPVDQSAVPPDPTTPQN
ncbi:MAG: TonB family protein [Candidatus Acidiferrales bacterium]